ncbi:hypothetical protein [Thalassovita taeanensis]|uniref:Lipoprotein n=1 Tax=Thalassovita taeanensis TaxID=657014 RepID=A0A1H9FPC5_9RHOB|nr:hypothetical protein [Thalassovita taeanensis]SEQ39732.1 hypothetical protein SAMN04488092_106164 [Thalassovita taeanensis]
MLPLGQHIAGSECGSGTRGLKRVAAAVMALALVAGCNGKVLNPNSTRVAFEGLYFKARLSASKEDKQDFTVTVSPASQGLSAAREAGRYEATKYCVSNYGSSEVIWGVGPDSPDSALVITDDVLALNGRCTG